MSPEQSGGAALSILDATKVYRESVAVDHISLDVAAGEFLTMLGSSGSGKTTTLNAIAGFIRLTREGKPNLFLYKHDIKYLHELS